MAVMGAFASAIGDVIGRRDDDAYRRQVAARNQRDYKLRADELAFKKHQLSEQARIREEEAGKFTGPSGRSFEDTAEGHAEFMEWRERWGAAGRAPPPMPPPTMTERAGEAQAIFEDTGMQVPGFGYPEEPEEPSPMSWETLPGEAPGDRVRRLQHAYGMPYGEISRYRERSRLDEARTDLGMREGERDDLAEEEEIRRQIRRSHGRP
tara:strand:- start:108 stop:731 length:624 start_codon:yes stop_codon:yes gene_type:complete